MSISLPVTVTMAESDLKLLDRLCAQNGVTRQEFVEATVHQRLALEAFADRRRAARQ